MDTIEASVLGREDKRLNRAMNMYMFIYVVVFVVIEYIIITAPSGNFGHSIITLFSAIFFIFISMFVFFPIGNIVERRITGKDENTKYAVRIVTTDIGNDYLCVFKESYNGRFTDYSDLQTKTHMGCEVCYFPKEDPAQAFEFKRQLEDWDRQKAIANQKIVTIHPKA